MQSLRVVLRREKDTHFCTECARTIILDSIILGSIILDSIILDSSRRSLGRSFS